MLHKVFKANNLRIKMINKKASAKHFVIGIVTVLILLVAYTALKPSPGASSISGNALKVKEVAPTDTPSSTSYSIQEVSSHSTQEDCWVIVDGKVYDVTKVIPTHPGGVMAIASKCGTDASVTFNTKNGKGTHSPKAHSVLATHLLGNLKN